MKYLVKIDRKSIKKNPTAGKTQTRVQTKSPIVRFEAEGLDMILPTCLDYYTVNNEGEFVKTKGNPSIGYICEMYKEGESLVKIKGELFSSTFIDCLLNQRLPNLTIIKDARDCYHVINHMPEPKYLFKYLPTKVRCKECKKEFLHTELESNMYDDNCTDTMCPKCGVWDCCEIEYEDIKSVIKN